jgi:hypothetical protein
MTSVAVAAPNGGTGFGSSGASSVFSVIVTGASPLFVTRHDTVVSPVAGSHSAFAAYTTDGGAGSAAAIVVVGAAVVVVASAIVVGNSVVGDASVVGASVGGATVGCATVGCATVGCATVGCTGVGASVVVGVADDVDARASPHTDEATNASPDKTMKRRRRSVMLSPCY